MHRQRMPVRREKILELLAERGEITVEALVEHFETSSVTIRKDLAALEAAGYLVRRYGGATLIAHEGDQGVTRPSPVKQAIACAAAARLRDHTRIIVDSGSTTGALIPWLNRYTGLVVMTNALGVAGALRSLERPPALLMTGGTWDPHSGAFQGSVAETVLRAYDFDQLFIGADGVDLDRGTTTFNELVGLSRVMAETAREVVVMVESEKIGRRIPNLELAWSQIDVLITDDALAVESRQRILQQQVTLIVVSAAEHLPER